MAVPHSRHVSPELMATCLQTEFCSNLTDFRSSSQDRHEVTEFIVHLCFGGDRLRDLLSQHRTETLTQAVHRDINRADADTAPGGQLGARNGPVAIGKKPLKFFEQLALIAN